MTKLTVSALQRNRSGTGFFVNLIMTSTVEANSLQVSKEYALTKQARSAQPNNYTSLKYRYHTPSQYYNYFYLNNKRHIIYTDFMQ